MEYTDLERQVLSLMERIDFKNLSRNDVISYASKLNELRPEVATQVLEQFPELAKLIQSLMVEYKDILENIVASDDASTNQVYKILNKELEGADESRKQYIEFADKVRSDLSKCLDNLDLTQEQQKEIREQEMETAGMADRKDSEKKAFNWKVLGSASVVILTAVGIGTSALGGNFNIKLPKPKQ